jgi:CMP-2-keto-3-deoxyoctulosonic acid synthetase
MKPPAWQIHIPWRLDTCPCSFSEKGLYAFVREGLDHFVQCNATQHNCQ